MEAPIGIFLPQMPSHRSLGDLSKAPTAQLLHLC